jgi:hypothetical protein
MPEWKRARSGLFLPDTVPSTGTFEKKTYLDVRNRGIALERLCDSLQIKIKQSSVLRRMMSSTDSLWKTWFSGKISQIQYPWLWDSLSLDVVSNALLPLEGEADAAKFLKTIVKADVGMLSRGQSLAKDYLWELEVWSKLKYRGAAATLSEPDVIWEAAKIKTGIACKKVYSEKNTERMLSGAVSQIENWTGLGVVAISLDELLPPTPRQFRSADDAQRFLQVHNQNYLHRHQRLFRHYFSADRLTAALISSSQIVVLGSIPPSIHSEWTVWTFPNLAPENAKRFQQLRALLA